jgi:anhydro-N-acetylmuramic acid kinase
VVGDFRSLDVALGGQGAPLVPIGDRLLFSQYDFCLNLGGISNISFEHKDTRIAFDIGIANMLLNYLSKQAGAEFDKGGEMARSGQIIPELLKELDALPFYHKPFPKSTGYEWFKAEILPIFRRFPGSPNDQLRTAAEHISGQITNQVLALKSAGKATVLATGGGALNTFLMELMKGKGGKQILWEVPEPELINYKEALIFALLGALRLSDKINVLSSVTGSRRDSCSGIIYLP